VLIVVVVGEKEVVVGVELIVVGGGEDIVPVDVEVEGVEFVVLAEVEVVEGEVILLVVEVKVEGDEFMLSFEVVREENLVLLAIADDGGKFLNLVEDLILDVFAAARVELFLNAETIFVASYALREFNVVVVLSDLGLLAFKRLPVQPNFDLPQQVSMNFLR
jgi:hypothetical protein